MSEEEILKECTELAENEHHELGDCWDEEYSSSAIFGLIMLYKQTKKELNNLKEIEKSHKEKNGKLRVEFEKVYEDNLSLAQELEQEKEKNKELSDKLIEKICNGVEEDILEEYRQQIRELKETIEKDYISKDKIRNDLKICQEVFEKEMKPYQTEYGLDVTYLSKKEKAELINKRNCLLTQMKTYEMLLEEK